MGSETLVDLALRNLGRADVDCAVNVHVFADDIAEHVEGRAHVSWEREVAMGTAGALRHMAHWLDGRAALTVNADTVCDADLGAVVDGWDGRNALVAHTGAVFGPGCGVVASITPADVYRSLPDRPCGLFESVWAPAQSTGRLQTVAIDAQLFDCGTPQRYLDANLALSGGATVAFGATVAGSAEQCVVWPGATVAAGEQLFRAIRTTGGVTVYVR